MSYPVNFNAQGRTTSSQTSSVQQPQTVHNQFVHVYGPVFQTILTPSNTQDKSTREKILHKLVPFIDPSPKLSLEEEIKSISENPEKFSSDIKNIQNLLKTHVKNLDGSGDQWKTDLCKNREYCLYKHKCKFAHSLKTLYAINLLKFPNYKMLPCPRSVRLANGRTFCPYGSKCHAVHEGELMHVKDTQSLFPKFDTWTIYRDPQRQTEQKYVDDLLNEATTAYQKDYLRDK